METLTGIPNHDFKFNASKASNIPTVLGTQYDESSRAKRQALSSARTNSLGYPIPNLFNYNDLNALTPATELSKAQYPNSSNVQRPQIALDPRFSLLQLPPEEDQTRYYHRTTSNPSQAIFAGAYTTTNVSHDAASTWDTGFIHQPQPRKSYTNLSTRIDHQPPISSPSPSSSARLIDEEQSYPPRTVPSKTRRHDSIHEERIPSSGRAMYLMKNRNAARKCRNKQKKEQDELVEKVRDVEQTNKLLKTKVAILEKDLGDLMEIVGQHRYCLDNKLSMYVQREAHRASSTDPEDHVAGYKLSEIGSD